MSAQEGMRVNWRDIVPPGWTGRCCHCGALLTCADWKAQNVIAVIDRAGHAVLCLRHALGGGEEYRAALRSLAHAIAGVIAANEGGG